MNDGWDEATKDVKKLCAKARHVARKTPVQKQARISEPRLPYHPSGHLHTLVCGQLEGIDGTTSKKLKRGQLPVEASLDLHGMTQEEAFAALGRCLAQAALRGLRVVLVVTGKGRETEGGILKKALPRWLNLPEFRPHILAFTQAAPAQGGAGAVVVLLKRRQS